MVDKTNKWLYARAVCTAFLQSKNAVHTRVIRK